MATTKQEVISRFIDELKGFMIRFDNQITPSPEKTVIQDHLFTTMALLRIAETTEG